MENAISNNDFKNTISILNDTDKLNSVESTYGKKIDLDKTIFYQDIVSSIISEEYGLYLRNKDYFVSIDTKYIKYKAYTEDDYLTEIHFELNSGPGYDTINLKDKNNCFEYNIGKNKFTYYVKANIVYVYKNEEYVGNLNVTHKGKVPEDTFKELNYIFGIGE